MSTADELPTLHPHAVSPGAFVHIIIACIFTLLAAICVVLRFVQRRRSREFWWDDWAILGSLVFAFGGVLVCTLLISAPSIGAAGYHINTYTVDQLNTYFKLMLAANVLYNPSIALSKASILFFYRHIFSVDGQFLMFMRIMGFFIIGNCLAAMLGLIFSSNPVEAQWNVGLPATTINGPAFWAVMAVVNIVLEMAILAIAQIKVWKLQLSPRKKLLISGVLLLGAL
jgi:energy-converting hydrogenase Eha subunit A